MHNIYKKQNVIVVKFSWNFPYCVFLNIIQYHTIKSAQQDPPFCLVCYRRLTNFVFPLSRTFGRRVLGRKLKRVGLIASGTLWVGDMSFRVRVSLVNSWVNM